MFARPTLLLVLTLTCLATGLILLLLLLSSRELNTKLLARLEEMGVGGI